MKKRSALIERAVREYAPEVIVFPELFLPGYPYGMNFGFSVGERTEEGRAEWLRYSTKIPPSSAPGVETAALCAAAREHGIWLSIGISERERRDRHALVTPTASSARTGRSSPYTVSSGR